MTNPDYRHYILIVDRSGSMCTIQDEAQAGIRSYVKDQAEIPGKATLTLCEFDNEYKIVHDFAPLAAAVNYTLKPRNMTALLDACGMTVTSVGEKLAAMPEAERPGKVIVLITTDGKENASREYKLEQVKALFIEQQETYNWQISYVGANVDAFAEAASIGLRTNSTMNFAATGRGTAMAYAAASASSTRYATGQSCDTHFTDDERDEAADK